MMYHHKISRVLAKAVCIFIFFYFPDSKLFYCIKWSISTFGGVTVITSNSILQNNWLMNKMVKPNEDLADETYSNCRSPRFKLCFMSVFNLAVFFFLLLLLNLLHFTERFYGLFSIKKYIQNYFGAIINNF